MAFIFVPNADGGFDEGDKQTNPDTGVEYIFTDGAWRPLGPKFEDQFDELDDRYLVRTGDDMSDNSYINFPGGGLHFKHTDGVKKSYFYNAAEGITQWTAYNGTQLKVTARDGDPGSGRTYIDIKTADSTGAEGEDTGYRMKLFHVADPTGDFQAANKRYVDQNSQPPTPARFKWEWVGKAEDHAGNTLATGQFSGPQLGQGNTTYGLLYYLNLTALNASHRINSRPNDEEMSFPDANGGPLLSLWSDPVTSNSSTITLMCVQRIKRLKFVGTNYQTDGGFIEIETHQGSGYSHHFAGSGLSYNRHYYIQLSGIF